MDENKDEYLDANEFLKHVKGFFTSNDPNSASNNLLELGSKH